MSLRSFFALVPLVILSIIGTQQAVAESAPAPIVIGVVHSAAHPSAEQMKRSFDMAVEARNQEGSINGRPLKLVYADDGLRAAGSIGYQRGGEEQAVRSLKDQGAVLIMGGYSSANTIHTAVAAEKHYVPFLVTTAADNQITQRGFRNVFRLNQPASEYGTGVEKLLDSKVQPKSMAIVYEASRYGTDTAASMLSFCRDKDIRLTKLIPYQKDRVSPEYFEKRLRHIQKDPPDVIFMVSYLDDAISLVKKLRELEIGSLLIGAGGGFTDSRFISALGEGSAGVLTASLWSSRLPYEGATAYHDSYLAKYQEVPDYHGAEAYSAVLVAADALGRAESLDPEAVRKALNATDLETPFGHVRFQSYGKYHRQNSTQSVVLEVADSGFKFVWPEDIAKALAASH